MISFEKNWFPFKSKCLCQKNYDSTLVQSTKLKTNTSKVEHQLEHLFEGYLKQWKSFLMLFGMSMVDFVLIPSNFCVNFQIPVIEARYVETISLMFSTS